MDDTEMDIVLRAVDDASDTFEQVQSAAEDMGESVQSGAEQGSEGLDEMEASGENAADPLEQISTIIGGLAGAEIFSQLADALWDVADKAGTFEDSLMRARLEAEGAGIDVNDMTDAVSELSATTGRAGGEIRESFIKATARGITDLGSFKQMMEGAGAQATLLGTDIGTMADKMSGLAMRSTVMEKTLANTGITVEELGEALGIQGATIDDINEKWATLDTNQKAAALGMAASMNEGQTANEEYKNSWAGLQAQIDIAKGRIERLAGEVLLPVLIPALEVAARVLNFLGDTISAVMNGPLGGLISVVGASAAAFALAVPAYMAVSAAYDFITGSAVAAAAAELLALWPVLLIAAALAALTYVVYEVGKAFGWWTDVSSMLDAIWAGIQRLWSAFINHPDVQAFLSALTAAWNWLSSAIGGAISWVMSFFKSNDTKNFDIVSMWINNVSMAWKAMTAPIRLVISVIKQLWNAFQLMYAKCKEALDKAKNAFDSFKEKVKNIINKVKEKIKSLTGIDISELASKIAQPVADAYEKIKKTVEKIKSKIKEIPSNVGSASLGPLGAVLGLGFDYEGMLEEMNSRNSNSSYVTSDENLTLDHNINFKFDFTNLPDGTSEENLIAMLQSAITDRSVINSLVNSPDFQSLDGKVKERLVLKNGRARGA